MQQIKLGVGKMVFLDNITYLKGEGNYTLVYLITGGRPYMVTKTLKVIIEKTGFLRIHKSMAVNPRHVERVLVYPRQGGEVVMNDGTILPTSRRLAIPIRQAISNYKSQLNNELH